MRPSRKRPIPVSRASGPPDAIRTWSGAETLRDQDFADVTPAELEHIRAALSALAWNPGQRRTRRWTPGRGARIDLRRAWRESLRSGELLRLPTRARTTRPRPLVLLADVSGSMERYSRMLLHFAYALQRARGRVEVFLFSTRLTCVTRELTRGSVDAAVMAVSRRVPDWSGGTRIGDALRTFHVRWARSVLSRRPVVLMVSDGWDRGDPVVLQQQVARLQRSCHRLIWLSPLLGTARLPPAHARARRRAALRGRLPAGAHAGQSGRPRASSQRPARRAPDAPAVAGEVHNRAMTLDGTYTFAAPRTRVWQLLMDPTEIASCVPGCERFEPVGDDNTACGSPPASPPSAARSRAR